jgi:hypothetical protein
MAMLYAVIPEEVEAILFLTDNPGEGPWKVAEGVSLDAPVNLFEWPEGTERPMPILCVSQTDQKHYKVFKHPNDIDSARYQRAGKIFGGIYSKSSWEQFAKHLMNRPIHGLDAPDVPDAEPPGATDEAIAAVKRGR